MNPVHFLTACIVPSGRLTVVGYIVLSGLVGSAHTALSFQLASAEAATPGMQHLLYLVLLWMHFCLMSRRLHDAGYGNWPAFALFFVYTTLSFMSLCPGLFEGESTEQSEEGSMTASLVALLPAVALAHKALWAILVLTPGETGANLYGPEFGEGPAISTAASREAAAQADAQRRAAFEDRQHAQNNYKKIAPPGSAKAWGERKRAGGFGQR